MRADKEILAGIDKELCVRLATLHTAMLEAMSQGGKHTIAVNPQMASDVLEAIVSISYRSITDRIESASK